MKNKTWEDSYIVVYYSDGGLLYKKFSNNIEAAQYLQELPHEDSEFNPYLHSLVIKTEKDAHSILSVRTQKITKVVIGEY